MDNLCHTLLGAALAQSGLKKRSPLGTATLLIAANLPDVDAISLLWGRIPGFAFRRGWTHGVLAIALWPFLLAAAMLAFDRLGKRRGARFWPLVFLSAIGVMSHPLLDLLNTYGVRWLMPFSNQWYYGDTLFIVDIWVWLALAAGILISVQRERRGRLDWRSPPRVALGAAALYTGGCSCSGGWRCPRCDSSSAPTASGPPSARVPDSGEPRRTRHRGGRGRPDPGGSDSRPVAISCRRAAGRSGTRRRGRRPRHRDGCLHAGGGHFSLGGPATRPTWWTDVAGAPWSTSSTCATPRRPDAAFGTLSGADPQPARWCPPCPLAAPSGAFEGVTVRTPPTPSRHDPLPSRGRVDAVSLIERIDPPHPRQQERHQRHAQRRAPRPDTPTGIAAVYSRPEIGWRLHAEQKDGRRRHCRRARVTIASMLARSESGSSPRSPSLAAGLQDQDGHRLPHQPVHPLPARPPTFRR